MIAQLGFIIYYELISLSRNLGYKAYSNTVQKIITAEYHDFIVFSVAFLNIIIKIRPLFMLTERHGSGIIRQMYGSCLGEQL